MKRKPAKGELRRNKLHIPHPARRLRRTGVVRSVVPPFPTRIAALDSRGSPVPFANPLKTTKKVAAAPFLGFSPGLGLCGICFQIYKTCYRCVLLNWRGIRNTLRLFRMYLAWKSVCARYAMQPLQEGRPFDFHTSNIQRAQTERHVWPIVRLGNPILRQPEGRSDYGLCNDKTQNGTTSLSGATALFGVQRSFLPYLFCQDRKDMARGAAVTALRIEPRPRRIRNGPAEQNPCLWRKAHLCC